MRAGKTMALAVLSTGVLFARGQMRESPHPEVMSVERELAGLQARQLSPETVAGLRVAAEAAHARLTAAEQAVPGVAEADGRIATLREALAEARAARQAALDAHAEALVAPREAAQETERALREAVAIERRIRSLTLQRERLIAHGTHND